MRRWCEDCQGARGVLLSLDVLVVCLVDDNAVRRFVV